MSDNVIGVINALIGDTPTSPYHFNLGRRPLGNSYYYNGILDEIGVWDRELTSTEVTELYNSGSGKQYPN